MSSDPYLSVVVTSRNDNHGGTLTRRMQIFVDSLIAQCRRFHLPAELIFVEWNPPSERPRLAEALRWPAQMSPCTVRIIEVPPEIHARYEHGGKLPLYQMIAKNVGIRRARGEFVLATNIDILFNDELMQFLAERKLQRGHMYRIDRTDVDAEVPEGAPIEETLAYCHAHRIRINAREGTFALRPDGRRAWGEDDIADPDSGLTFANGFGPLEHTHGPANPRACRWLTNDAEIGIDGIVGQEQSRFLILHAEFGPSSGGTPLPITVLDQASQVIFRHLLFPGDPIVIPVTLKPRYQQLQLHLDSPNLQNGLDPRFLNLLVRRVELSDQPPTTQRPADIIEADCRCCLGLGWYDMEQWKEQRFRWINNDARIYIEGPATGSRECHLSLDVGLGPGTDYDPVTLSVHGDQGQVFARLGLLGSRLLAIPIHLHSGLNLLTIHVDGPNIPRQPDGQILNINVSRLVIAKDPVPYESPPNILHSDIPLDLGKGWYDLEEWEGKKLRWLNNNAKIHFEGPTDGTLQRYLILDVEPGPGTGYEPVKLRVIDDHHKSIFKATLWGPNLLCIPVELHPGTNSLTLHVEGPNLPRQPDGAVLNLKVTSVALREAPESRPENQDIVTADIPLGLGLGWYDVEEWEGKKLRWLKNDARIYLDSPETGMQRRYLSLDVEFGPGTGYEPVGIRVTDEKERTLLQLQLLNARTLYFPVELHPGCNTLVVHIAGPNLPRQPDGSILNLKVTRIALTSEPVGYEPPPDITRSAYPLSLGRGWYELEVSQGQKLRWLDNEAKIYLEVPEEGCYEKYLVLDVEPGPSAGEAPLHIALIDSSGQFLLETYVVRQQVLSVPLTLNPGLHRLTLRLQSPSLPFGSDSRILNLQVRRVEISDDPVVPSAAPDITSSTMIRFGSECDALEFYDGRHSRWLFTSANIWVVGPQKGQPIQKSSLYLELDRGPSLGSVPPMVRLLDHQDHELFRAMLKGPQVFSIPVTVSLPVQRFRLDFKSPNVPIPGDSRLLNVKLVRVELTHRE